MKYCRICGRELKTYEAQMAGVGHVCANRISSRAEKAQASIFDIDTPIQTDSWIDRVVRKFMPCLDFATPEQIEAVENVLREILKHEKK